MLPPHTWKVMAIYWQEDWGIANGLKSYLAAFKLQRGQPVKRLHNISTRNKKAQASDTTDSYKSYGLLT